MAAKPSAAKLTKLRREIGLCYRCGEQPAPGKKKCEKCLEQGRRIYAKRSKVANQLDKDRQQARLTSDLCEHCGLKEPKHGTRRCHDCLKKRRAYLNNRKRERQIVGVCDRHTLPAIDGLKYCTICMEQNKKRKEEQAIFRKENGLCRCCGEPTSSYYCKKCAKQKRKRTMASGKRIKKVVLDHYGGRCACPNCPEHHNPKPDQRFLTIDHTNGGGRQHREELKRHGFKFYQWLRKNHYPDGFQVLCWNCNCSKGVYGRCPHEEWAPPVSTPAD